MALSFTALVHTARAAQPRMANVSTGVNDSCAAAANATSTQSDSGALNLAISIILTVAGAALLAFTMVVQRFGLAYPKPRIPMCGLKIPRLLVWFFGMVLYGPANGLKIAAWSLGPQSALGSIFSILLIFNLIFARWLLKETITTAKVASSLIILAGAITCTIGAPTGVKVNFTDRDIVELFSLHAGFVSALVSVMAAGLALIVVVEVRYPSRLGGAAAKRTADPEEAAHVAAAPRRTPPKWIVPVLAIVFPGALGLDEASADLMIRAWSSMLGMCSREEGCADCATPVFWATVVAWTVLAFGGSLALMPIVYKRFEVSVALPVEYGAVNFGAVAVALGFYDEHLYMESWQLALQLVGCALILVGIGVGQVQCGRGSEPSPKT